MRKITLLTLFFFYGLAHSQCLSSPNGQYPATTFNPICDGTNTQTITAAGYAGEYSMVSVISGETYTFSSSITTDYITISDEAGINSLAFGAGGLLEWISDTSGIIRFYTHTNANCGSNEVFRLRKIKCGTPPSCISISNLHSEDVLETSATVAWTESPSAPSLGYDYIFSDVNTVPDDNSEPTGSIDSGTSVGFDDLTGMTTYYVWVRANCGSGDYSTWKSVSFTTTAAAPDCEAAVPIDACGTPVMASLSAGAGAWNPMSCGYATPGSEAIYSFTPAMTGVHKLQVTANSGGYIDYFWKEAGACSGSGWTCIDDINSPGTYNIGELTEGTEYLFLLDGEGTATIRTATFLITCPPTCTNGVVTYSTISGCDGVEEQFYISGNLTNMGTAESYTATDDQGSVSLEIIETGTFQFGPYPLGTNVVITLSNDQDETCVMTSSAITMNLCPPVNDTCDTAIDLGELQSPVSATTVGALNDSPMYCSNTGQEVAGAAPDVYYSISVPDGSTLTIGQLSNGYDSTNRIFYGSCENQMPITCFDDDDDDIVTWANTTGETQTVYWVQDGFAGASGTFVLQWSVIACANPVATFNVISDCGEDDQFFLDVDLTSMGSGASVTITDDQGSLPVIVAEPGTVSFGPYPNGTPVVLTVANDDDADCTLISSVMTQNICPPNCDNADVISVCGEPTVLLLEGAGVWNGAQCGFSVPGAEKVYSFTPGETGMYNLVITASTGGYVDYFYKVAGGSCDAAGWLCIGDATGPETNSIGLLTAGVEYLILADAESTTSRNVTFHISCAVVPPANDSCATATAIEAFPFEEQQDASGATNNSGFVTQCNGMNDGVWYSFTGDGGEATITVADPGWDSEIAVYTGACGMFTCVDSEDGSGSGGGEELTISTTDGEIYYLNIGHYSGTNNATEGQYTITVTTTVMSVETIEDNSLKYYPNPVSDVLHISHTDLISQVQVYNLPGQLIMSRNFDKTDARLNLSELQAGTYIIKVNSGDSIKTLKILKE